MTKKWWKTGRYVLAMAVGLLICAMPAMGGDIAPRHGGVEDPGGALSALDGSFLTVPQGQYVIVKFSTAVGRVGDYYTLRIHMDGTSTDVSGTKVSLSNDGSSWRGFLGDLWANTIDEYDWGQCAPPDGLTDDWFQFSVYYLTWGGLPRFPFETFQYVKIQAPDGASISIDAVEALPFTELPVDPVVMIADLIDSVDVINGEQGISNSLDAKLASAQEALQDANTNNDVSAVNKLQAFINEVEAQAGKQLITAEQAAGLIDQAEDIIAILTGS